MIYPYNKTTIKDRNYILRFLFTFHQLVDACRKFANSGSKIITLRCCRCSRLQENLFI